MRQVHLHHHQAHRLLHHLVLRHQLHRRRVQCQNILLSYRRRLNNRCFLLHNPVLRRFRAVRRRRVVHQLQGLLHRRLRLLTRLRHLRVHLQVREVRWQMDQHHQVLRHNLNQKHRQSH